MPIITDPTGYERKIPLDSSDFQQIEYIAKTKAIAFGQWLLKAGYFISMIGAWAKITDKPVDRTYEYFTTEQLYQEFEKFFSAPKNP